MSIKTLLVDDSPETLQVLRLQYSLRPEFSVVGQASSAQEAMSRMAEIDVDLVSIDIQLGRDNGLDLCAWIHNTYPSVFTVVCSLEAEEDIRFQAIQSGANAFMSKPVSGDDLLGLIRTYRETQTPPDDLNTDKAEWLDDLLD